MVNQNNSADAPTNVENHMLYMQRCVETVIKCKWQLPDIYEKVHGAALKENFIASSSSEAFSKLISSYNLLVLVDIYCIILFLWDRVFTINQFSDNNWPGQCEQRQFASNQYSCMSSASCLQLAQAGK